MLHSRGQRCPPAVGHRHYVQDGSAWHLPATCEAASVVCSRLIVVPCTLMAESVRQHSNAEHFLRCRRSGAQPHSFRAMHRVVDRTSSHSAVPARSKYWSSLIVRVIWIVILYYLWEDRHHAPTRDLDVGCGLTIPHSHGVATEANGVRGLATGVVPPLGYWHRSGHFSAFTLIVRPCTLPHTAH